MPSYGLTLSDMNSPVANSSATLKPVVSAPVQTNTQPTQSTLGAQTSNTGGNTGGKLAGGWYLNPQTGKTEQWNGSGWGSVSSNTSSNNSNSGSSINWDDLYAPLMSSLDQSAQSARDNATLAQGDIDTGAQGQLRSIDTEIGNSNTAYQTTTDRATENKTNALQDAIRSYNALKQQGNARFGGGSSAGAAVGELAQQEYFRNQGKIETSANQTLADIGAKWTASLKSYSDAKLDLQDKVQIQKSQVVQQLNSTLAAINQQKGQAESDKSAQRMNALQKAADYTNQINAIKTTADANLNNWIQQEEYLVHNNLVQTYSNQPSSNVAGGTFSQLGTGNSSVASQGLNITYNPNTKRYEDGDGNAVTF